MKNYRFTVTIPASAGLDISGIQGATIYSGEDGAERAFAVPASLLHRLEDGQIVGQVTMEHERHDAAPLDSLRLTVLLLDGQEMRIDKAVLTGRVLDDEPMHE